MRRIFWNASEGRPRAGWRLALQLLCNLGLAIALYLALRAATAKLLDPAVWSDLARYAVFLVATVLTVAAAARWLDRRPFADLGLHLAASDWWADLALGLVLAAVPIAALALLARALGWVTIEPALVSGIAGAPWGLGLLVALLQYLCVAFFEELARAYHIRNLFEGTRGRLGLVGAAVVGAAGAALISVVMHIGPAVFLLFVFLDTAMYALCYLLTGRIAIAAGHHLAWDLLLSTVLVGQEIVPLEYAAAVFFVRPAGGVLPALSHPDPLVLVGVGLGILAYEAINVALVLAWVRLRRGRVGLHDGLRPAAPPS